MLQTKKLLANIPRALEAVFFVGFIGTTECSASGIAIHAREMFKAPDRIARTIARETGKSLDMALADIMRDRWLSAEEAVEFRLVSRILERKTRLSVALVIQ